MRFGGHQTFSIRDGWMFKGLQALIETPEAFGTDTLRDQLGVGKNMARSIHHWLLALGLAEAKGSGQSTKLTATELGQEIWKYDRFFLYPGTWWILHAQLVNNPTQAYSWNWFFNEFTQSRFERAVVVEDLRRQLLSRGDRMPSLRTLERDVACLLRSYSRVLPRVESDPEDNLECPLVDLGLMTHSRQSGFFHLDRSAKPIPFPVFGWVVSRSLAASEEREVLDFALTELAYERGGPGRVFALSLDALFEMVSGYEAAQPDRISMTSQAGERVVRIENQPGSDWVEEYLSALPQEDEQLAETRVA